MSVAAPPQIYKGHDEGSYFLNVPAFPGRKCPVWISFEDWESRDCECKNIKIIITQYLSSIYSMHGKFSETQRANNSNNCDLFFRALLAASTSSFNIINSTDDSNSSSNNHISSNGRNQNTYGLATSRYELSNSTRRRFTIQTIYSDS